MYSTFFPPPRQTSHPRPIAAPERQRIVRTHSPPRTDIADPVRVHLAAAARRERLLIGGLSWRLMRSVSPATLAQVDDTVLGGRAIHDDIARRAYRALRGRPRTWDEYVAAMRGVASAGDLASWAWDAVSAAGVEDDARRVRRAHDRLTRARRHYRLALAILETSR